MTRANSGDNRRNGGSNGAPNDALKISNNVNPQTLLHEISHRVGGSLQIVASLTSQAEREILDNPDPQQSVEALRRVRRHVMTIALVQGLLYGKAPTNGRFSSFVESLGEHLKTIYDRPLIKIQIEERAEIALVHTQPVGLMLCELITNALRHGFDDDAAGTISVTIKHKPPNATCLIVADDGRGFQTPPAIDPHRGLGLVHDLICECGGRMEWLPQEKGAAKLLVIPT